MTQPPTDDMAPMAGAEASGIGSGGLPAPVAGTQAVDFAVIVPRFESALLRYVSQLLGRGDSDLEDIVQDAFLRLHRQVHQHGHASVQNVSTWLFRVAHNLTMDTLRKRKVRKQTQQKLTGEVVTAKKDETKTAGNETKSSSAESTSAGISSASLKLHHDEDTLGDMERREACDHAMAQLRTLPDVQRQALTLKMIEGLTIRQIAVVTDTSIGNVGYRISQGLAELSRRLKKSGVI